MGARVCACVGRQVRACVRMSRCATREGAVCGWMDVRGGWMVRQARVTGIYRIPVYPSPAQPSPRQKAEMERKDGDWRLEIADCRLAFPTGGTVQTGGPSTYSSIVQYSTVLSVRACVCVRAVTGSQVKSVLPGYAPNQQSNAR